VENNDPPIHLLLTGVTGFLGQAVLERLLFSYRDCRVSVLVRPRADATAGQRLESLLSKPVFGPLRATLGDAGLQSLVDDRVCVIPGDLTDMPTLPPDLDTVVHAASNVNFDAPIDESFEANVAGPEALYRSLLAARGHPAVVHVSTAYVAGLRRGVAMEAPLDHPVDYACELAFARSARAKAEQLSRTPEILEMLLRGVRREHRRAGNIAVAQAAEQSRIRWIRDRLIAQGHSRAQSLGWTDAYTMTKALGERVAEQLWAASGHRLTILRPSIVESALRHPYPGWIDGYKVADPLIGAYGRGQLREFPALADTVIDIVPVDFVVNAVLAAAFSAAMPRQTRYFHVSSGTTNPLRIEMLATLTTEYFAANPMEQAAAPVTPWEFRHPVLVKATLRRREVAVKIADTVVAQLPANRHTRAWSTTLHRGRRDLGLLTRFIEMYQPYTQIEILFDDRCLRALHAVLDPALRAEHGFDVTDINWRSYLQEVHIPQISRMARRRTSPVQELDGQELPRRTDVVAVFDLHRTVAANSLIEHYLWVELARRPISRWPLLMANLTATAPHYLLAERRDRADFVRTFMRRYAGCTDNELRKIVAEHLVPSLRGGLHVGALEKIEAHRAAGHRTILITGQVDVFVDPLAELFDETVCGAMDIDSEGRCTGHLAVNPLVGEARAMWLRRYAAETGIDLSASYAYGDSYADWPWLQVVGHPHAVNPDLALYRYARQKRWPTHFWSETQENRAVPVLRSIRAGR
jgi:HAD superfamily hydrolase (TIGR01490 family)